MHIKVIYGDGEQAIVNPNCYIKLISEYLRIKCDIPDSCELDLCNSAGELQLIHTYPHYTCGLDILTRRETYYLVKHEKDANGELRKPSLAIRLNLTQFDFIRHKLKKSHSVVETKKLGLRKNLSSLKTQIKEKKLSRKSDIKIINHELRATTNLKEMK